MILPRRKQGLRNTQNYIEKRPQIDHTNELMPEAILSGLAGLDQCFLDQMK